VQITFVGADTAFVPLWQPQTLGDRQPFNHFGLGFMLAVRHPTG
jgi:hypothetical protein